MCDKVRLGCIGVGSRGRYLLEAAAMHPAVEIRAAHFAGSHDMAYLHLIFLLIPAARRRWQLCGPI